MDDLIHHAASSPATPPTDTERLDWIAEVSQLANGFTAERQAWSEKFGEWQSVAYPSATRSPRTLISWGPKMGHFRNADTLREAIDAARAVSGPTDTEKET